MKQNQKTWLILLVAALLWLAASVVMSVRGLFDQPGEPPVYFAVFLTGLIASFLMPYKLSQRVRQALFAMPLWAIVAMHVFRFVGVFFVIDAISRALPPHFGWSAGLGDIIAATLSIPLAILIWRGYRPKTMRTTFIAWNIFGLADLFVAIALGVLYSESAVGLLSQPGLNSQALTHLPLSLIPTFYVPILILLHLLALRRIREVSP